MLPEAFLERMKRQLGDEYESYLDSLNRSRAVALRFNPLKGEIHAAALRGTAGAMGADGVLLRPRRPTRPARFS